MADHNILPDPLGEAIQHAYSAVPPGDRLAATIAALTAIAPFAEVVHRIGESETTVSPATESHADKQPGDDGLPPLTNLEIEVLDLLRRAPMVDGQPMSYTGPEIADALGYSLNHVKSVLGPSGELRKRGLITNRRRVGYRAVYT